MNQNTTEKAFSTLRISVLIVMSVGVIFPFLVLIMISLKTKSDFLLNPIGLPKIWNFKNYAVVFQKAHVLRSFYNSAFITACAIFCQILFGSMVSYALTKMNFKHSGVFSTAFLLPLIFPIQSIMIPIYIIFRNLGLINNPLGMIIIYTATGLPLVIFIMTGFMKTIPFQISEAAIVDGAGQMTIFTRLILPLLKPIVSTIIVISGLGIWNDFLMPLIMITKREQKTLPLIIYNFIGQYNSDWTLICTCIVFVIAPIITVYILLQKQVISGVVSGSVKG